MTFLIFLFWLFMTWRINYFTSIIFITKSIRHHTTQIYSPYLIPSLAIVLIPLNTPYLQLFVPLATTFLAYLILAYAIPDSTINYLVAPLVLTWLLAYFVSSMFSEIFRWVTGHFSILSVVTFISFPLTSSFFLRTLFSLFFWYKSDHVVAVTLFYPPFYINDFNNRLKSCCALVLVIGL